MIALYDACVLYPAPLRDLLMHLALSGLFYARWTETIHDEWIRNVLRDRRDITPEQLQRTRQLMNAHVLDSLVTGYESTIPFLTLPDPEDRHVLAAAITCHAEVIVTFNLKDFPWEILKVYGIRAQHSDDFVVHWLMTAPDIVGDAIKRQRRNLRNPPKSRKNF